MLIFNLFPLSFITNIYLFKKWWVPSRPRQWAAGLFGGGPKCPPPWNVRSWRGTGFTRGKVVFSGTAEPAWEGEEAMHEARFKAWSRCKKMWESVSWIGGYVARWCLVTANMNPESEENHSPPESERWREIERGAQVMILMEDFPLFLIYITKKR